MTGWFTDNLPLKLFSVFIALMVWVFVRVEERNELVLRVPVRYAAIPENLVVVSDPVSEIQFVVEGRGTLLTQVERGIGAYTIDFSGAQPGVQRIRVISDNIRLPRGVDVVRVVPSEVEVELQKTAAYRLPVQAILAENSIAAGFEISNVEIEPEIIEIVVGEGELDNAESLRTSPLPFSETKSDWSGIVPLRTDGLHVKSITTREVEVFVQVVPKIVERTITSIPVVVRGLADRYRVTTNEVSIKIAGPENLLKRLDAQGLEAYVQVRNPVDPGTRLPIFADLPDEVFLKEIIPLDTVVRAR